MLKRATKQHDRDIRHADVNAQVVESVLRKRMQEIERSPMGNYSQGLLCFSYGAGAVALNEFATAIALRDDDATHPLTRSLLDLRDAKLSLRGWEKAWRVPGWAYWRIVFTGFADEFEDELQQALAALPPLTPHEVSVVACGPFRDDEDPDEFTLLVLSEMYRAALNDAPERDALQPLIPIFEGAWSAGWDSLKESHEQSFPNLKWPFVD